MKMKTTVKTVWSSKDHKSKMFCGDSLDYMKSLRDNSIDCIWTDPPYFLSNGGITCQSGRMAKVDKGEWDKSFGIERDHAFNLSWLAECYRILKPNGTIWVSGTVHVYCSIGMAMSQVGLRILNDIIWEKPAPPPNLGCRCFTHSSEVILWATKASKKGREKYVFNYDQMKAENNGKQMKNVWRFNTASASEKTFGKHPTQKPLSLIDRCLRASTNKGDTVFDPFAGSSTTGVAALKLGRHYIGCEKSLPYAKLSKARLASTEKE